MENREAFYPRLVWVLDRKKFRELRILKHLPDIDDPRLADFEFCHRHHLCMIRKSELLHGKRHSKILDFYHPAVLRLILEDTDNLEVRLVSEANRSADRILPVEKKQAVFSESASMFAMFLEQ